jgi:hypothetical protein
MQWLSSRIQSGEPIQFGSRRMVVRSHAIQLSLPFIKGGIVWNRPFALQVQEGDGQEQTLPVVDVTRIAQVLILAAGVMAAIFVRRKIR